MTFDDAVDHDASIAIVPNVVIVRAWLDGVFSAGGVVTMSSPSPAAKSFSTGLSVDSAMRT
jgi:hypothetical protein